MNEIKHRSAFSFALPIMIPMGLSFFFLGLGFGLYATSQGFPWWTAPVLACTIFAGSMEFVVIGLLMAGFDPVNAFMLTLFVNGRHFFYGLSVLQRYVNMGWKWFPTVAWMCDESFAVNVSTKLPDDVDEKWFYFHVSWLNYTFWVVSTFVGGLFGNLLAAVDLRGIEKADKAIAKTREFFESLGISTHLKDYGLGEEAVDKIVKQLEDHGMTQLGEKGDITPEVAREILTRAL